MSDIRDFGKSGALTRREKDILKAEGKYNPYWDDVPDAPDPEQDMVDDIAQRVFMGENVYNAANAAFIEAGWPKGVPRTAIWSRTFVENNYGRIQQAVDRMG